MKLSSSKQRGHRNSEKGQATIEFLFAFPLITIGMFLVLFVAIAWYGHHLGATLTLDGISHEGFAPGSGVSRVSEKGALLPSFGFAGGGFFLPVSPSNRFIGDQVVMNVNGNSGETLSIAEFRIISVPRVTIIGPRWEFAP